MAIQTMETPDQVIPTAKNEGFKLQADGGRDFIAVYIPIGWTFTSEWKYLQWR